METIGKSIILFSGAEESSPGDPPDPPTPSEVMLYQRQSYFLFLGGEQWRLVAQGGFKGRQAGRQTGVGVVGVLNPGELGGPGGWVSCHYTSKCRLQVLVCPSGLSVGLRVVADERLTDALSAEQKALQTRDVNCGPRSETK